MWRIYWYRATTLPVIYLALISTYQVSSVWLECRVLQRKKGRKKRFVPWPRIEPGTPHMLGECSNHWATEALYFLCSPNFLSIIVLNCRHPYMRCDASSDDRATALPVIYLVLISTYQVSSACRALQNFSINHLTHLSEVSYHFMSTVLFTTMQYFILQQ